MSSNNNYELLPNEHNENPNASAYEKKRNIRKLGEAAFEGFATFLFMCTIFFTHEYEYRKKKVSGEGNVFGFWVILIVFGTITGAHINPAITIGFYFIEQDWVFGLIKMSLYVIFQFIGCISAIFLAFVIVGEHTIFTNSPIVGGITPWKIFFAEFFRNAHKFT